MKQFYLWLFSFFLLFKTANLLAAACCGSGFTIPSLITTDDKSQVAVTYQYSSIYADVFTNGNWQNRSDDDITQTVKTDFAHLLTDKVQAGISIPYQHRHKSAVTNQKNSSQGLADVSLILGYEYLSNWDYNQWKPKGIAFLSLILPTGRSIHESKDGTGIDARGRGFWGLAAGNALIKSWNEWDTSLNFEIHHSFSKHVDNQNAKGKIKPGQGGSIALSGGYSLELYRLGVLASWFYEDATDVIGDISSQGKLKRHSTASVVASRLFDNNSTLALSYSDDTLLGSPYNTSLSKSFLLFYQLRWER